MAKFSLSECCNQKTHPLACFVFSPTLDIGNNRSRNNAMLRFTDFASFTLVIRNSVVAGVLYCLLFTVCSPGFALCRDVVFTRLCYLESILRASSWRVSLHEYQNMCVWETFQGCRIMNKSNKGATPRVQHNKNLFQERAESCVVRRAGCHWRNL